MEVLMATTTLSPVYDALLDYLVEKATPQEIFAFSISDEAAHRAHHLMDRNNAGTLSSDEDAELQQVLYLERLVAMLKSRSLAAFSRMVYLSDSIRQHIRERAGGRCEYCHEPEQISLHGFHVDHIISQKHGGSGFPDNLAWACPACNITKGTAIASYDRASGALVPYFDPRGQDWDDHFEMDEDVILGRTAIGRVTVKMLEMNHPEKIETRRWLLKADRD